MVRIYDSQPNTSLWRDDPRSMASSPQTVVHRAASLPPPRRWHRKEYGIHIRSLTPRAPYPTWTAFLKSVFVSNGIERPIRLLALRERGCMGWRGGQAAVVSSRLLGGRAMWTAWNRGPATPVAGVRR